LRRDDARRAGRHDRFGVRQPKLAAPVRLAAQPDPSVYTLDAEGYVDVAVPSGLPANSSFNINLSANDGTTIQTESVPVVIKTSCKRHY
jgi:hypothetical protein